MSQRSTASFARGGVEWDPRTGRFAPPEGGWSCFHCNQRFMSIESARRHFGATPDVQALCLIEQKRQVAAISQAAASRTLLDRIIKDDRLPAISGTDAELIVMHAINILLYRR